jgi:hypothetical protein
MYSISLTDLVHLFKLVNRVPNATKKLNEIVESYIYEMGINAIERVSKIAINVSLTLFKSVLRKGESAAPPHQISIKGAEKVVRC